MSRKEQILTEAAAFVSANWKTSIPSVLIECFEEGAKWADSHPLSSTEEQKVKVEIRNCGEYYSTVVREMTKEEYDFLSDIAQNLNCEGGGYAPTLIVDILENE